MPNYPIHTVASALENSRPGLQQLQHAFGVIPNIAAAIANSPKLINSLVGVFKQVHSSSLSEQEIQIVLLTDAVANSSTYAVAFHTTLALQQAVSSEETDAIRERRVPADKGFAALSTLAKTLIEKRRTLDRAGTRFVHCRRLHKRTSPRGHRHSGSLDDHQLRWNHLQPSLGGAFSATRLAGLNARTKTGESAGYTAHPASIRIGGDPNGNAIHSGCSSTR
jgi:Carboxymuconolactone decarboxylase family